VFNQVKILDNDGQEVPQGVAGEICVSGRLVTQGYLNNRDANTESYKDGWLWTGDIGRMNHDGYIEIVDRRKDLIITGGFNVYPNEVEQAICGHPDVHECAVIGIPDEKWGEAVKGVVVLKPLTSVSAEEIIAMVKDALGSVKAPKTIDFVADLPRSPNGKVIKTEIRKQYWQDQERAVN
jgi:acyl-CoA synthetase (AMP-forming)/AMP-acid ligase II